MLATNARVRKAAANGYASLDSGTLVPAAQLPVMVGDTGSGGTKGAAPAPAAGDAAASKFLKADGTWARGVGALPGGTVTSVALTVPAELSVSGSPITASGTLAVTKANQSANQVYAGPTSGGAAAPAFRALGAADFPTLVGDTGSGGTKGAAPAPAAGDAAAGKFLKADGTWAAVSGGGSASPITLLWNSRHTLVTNARSQRLYIPVDCTVIDIYFSLPAANAGTTRVKVYKNGTSMFGATALPFVTAGFVSNHVVPDTTALVQDDYVEFEVTELGGAQGRLLAYMVATPA